MTRLSSLGKVMAFRTEATEGTLVEPDAGSQFNKVREGAGLSVSYETIESDEMTGGRVSGATFSSKENNTGNVPRYLKGSGVEGTAPEWAPLVKSAFGAQTDNATEYDTVAGSTAGTATVRAITKVDTGEGANFVAGQALLQKDTTNGYHIRNVRSISGVDLSLNFNRGAAPASGVNLGKANLWSMLAQPEVFFSAWEYQQSTTAANGFTQAIAGCRVSQIQWNFNANGLAEMLFQFKGVKGYWNPRIIKSTNKYIDITDDGGTIAVTLDEGIYNPIELADHITAKATAASVDVITCTYDSVTGRYTLASDGTTFSLLWQSGSNTANSVGTTLGFLVAANDTSATTYTSDNAITYAVPVTPAFDDVNPFVLKDQELMIGTFSQYLNRSTKMFSITMDTPVNDLDDLTAQSGIVGTGAGRASITFQAELWLLKHEAHLANYLKQNTDIEVMFNAGRKDASRYWIPGQTFNFYMPAVNITSREITPENDYFKAVISGRAKELSPTVGAFFLNQL